MDTLKYFFGGYTKHVPPSPPPLRRAGSENTDAPPAAPATPRPPAPSFTSYRQRPPDEGSGYDFDVSLECETPIVMCHVIAPDGLKRLDSSIVTADAGCLLTFSQETDPIVGEAALTCVGVYFTDLLDPTPTPPDVRWVSAKYTDSSTTWIYITV
jgi:hypothetical protein